MLEKVSEYCRLEAEKLKGMSFKGKLEYIWEYYKIPIIATLAGIFIIWSLVDTIWIHPPKKAFVQTAFLEGYQTDEALDAYARAMEAAVMTPEELEDLEAMAIMFMSESGDPQVDMANAQKLFAMVAANEIDLMLFPEELLPTYAEQQMVQDITPFLPPGIDEEYFGVQSALIEGVQVKCVLDASKVKELSGFQIEGYVMGVVTSTIREDNIKRALEWMLVK
ncbi:MAG: hypothetical protein LBT59_08715 [Clostridiales bacterium]|jgi:hypothetical protein|nr:hypothetical protein [Clostridiales bacterium]